MAKAKKADKKAAKTIHVNGVLCEYVKTVEDGADTCDIYQGPQGNWSVNQATSAVTKV